MEAKTITLQLPATIYSELQTLATSAHLDPVEMIAQWVSVARRRQEWLRGWVALREQIEKDGGLDIGESQDEIVERLRQTRREIWEAEYAHLYR